jgi:hypothetical protein
MRSDKELLAVQNYLVGQSEGVDFLYIDECDLTQEEVDYIRSLGDEIRAIERAHASTR